MDKNEEQTIRLSKDSLHSQAACPSRYEIKGIIGQGGMGMVFRAADLHLNRDVAIKILLFDGACDNDLQQRFLREAKALALLEHPNIVRIFASGVNERGNPYHVMEFIEGESLAQELLRGSLPASTFFEMMEQVLSALEHAHAQGIVHRDLKPSNIMHCQADSGKSLYKIIDFGIARVEMNADQAIKTLTRTEAILGSPNYISPEQCRGQRGDAQSDIYSLGCLMYECISGAPPFKGETAFETMYKQMNEFAPDLSLTARSAKSKDLAGLIASCLQKEPAKRPKSVTDLKNALLALRGEGLDLFDSSRKQSGFNPKSLVLLSIMALVGVIITLAHSMQSRRFQEEQKTIAVASNQQEQINKEISALGSRLSHFGTNPELIKDESSRKTYKNIVFELGRCQLRSHLPADSLKAERTFNKAITVFQQYGGDYVNAVPAAYVYLGKAKQLQAKYPESLAYFAKAQALVSAGAGGYSGKTTDILLQRAFLLLELRRFEECLKDFTEVQEHCSVSVENLWQELDPSGSVRTVLIAELADSLRKMNPASEKEALQMASLAELLSETLEKVPTRHTESIKSLNFAWRMLSYVSGHEDMKSRIKSKLPENLRRERPHIDPWILLNESGRLEKNGEPEKAIFVASQAVYQAEQNKKDYDTLARAYLRRGQLLKAQRRYKDALSDFENAERLSHKCHPSHELRGMSRIELAALMLETGMPGGEKLMRDVIQDCQENKITSNRYFVGLARCSLAEAYLKADKKAEAESLVKTQWELYTRIVNEAEELSDGDLMNLLKMINIDISLSRLEAARKHMDIFMTAYAKTELTAKQRQLTLALSSAIVKRLGIKGGIEKMKAIPAFHRSHPLVQDKGLPGGEFNQFLRDKL